MVYAQVYVCGVIYMPLLGTTGSTLSIVPSVAKSGAVSTGGQDNNYGNYTMEVCAIRWYRKHSIIRECLPYHMAKGGKVSKVAKVKVVEATQCVGDFSQVW